MALTIERLYHKHTGELMPGFFVRNAAHKLIAIGASPATGSGFVVPAAKRYARDVDLCRALGNLTGQPVKWNLVIHGKYISSHGRQALDRQIRNRHIWSH